MSPPDEPESAVSTDEATSPAEPATALPASGLLHKLASLHWLMVVNIIALIAFGLYAIQNAAAGRGPYYESFHLIQLCWVGIGAGVFLAVSLIDYKWLRWGSWLMYLGALASLIALKHIGEERSGARSWISIGDGLSLQPSQFAIIAGIAVLAIVFGDLQRDTPVLGHPLVRIALGGILAWVPMALIFKEPDLGTAFVWLAVSLGMILVSSIPLRYLISLALIVFCVPPLFYFFALKPYQQDRIDRGLGSLTYKDVKLSDLLGAGWTPYHLQLAVGSAGYEGKGPFSQKVEDQASIHRTFFPPQAVSDFIAGVCAEEFGFRGMLMLISGLLFLLLQCVFVAFFARDPLGRLLVIGVTSAMTAYIFLNIGMNLLLVPITGLPLPFISYGGTFMVVVLFMFGLVQSIWVHRHISPATKPGERERRE